MVFQSEDEFLRASFRDPAGVFWIQDGKALRWVFEESESDYRYLLDQGKVKEWIASKKLIPSKILSTEEQSKFSNSDQFPKILKQKSSGMLIEHKCITFPSYPYEWSPLMLYEAAQLTLELAEAALEFDFSLKDATPYNVLFEGSKPCFVDFLSFEKRNPLDGSWKAYGQFVRTFLLPLLCHQKFGISLKEIFLSQREGVEPSQVYRLASWVRKLSPSFLSLVSLPVWLEKKQNPSNLEYKSKNFSSKEQARFVLSSIFKHLRKHLNRLKPEKVKSHWSQYHECAHRTEDYIQAKQQFIRNFLEMDKPKKVLDIGCNRGDFSLQFAKAGSEVVSFDLDSAVIDHLYEESSSQNLSVLPLVMNLAWPSPGMGWAERENKSFLERAKGNFDAVLMYAVLHHLLVTAQIPLENIATLISRITQKYLLIEYVDPSDSLFRQIVRGRENLFEYLNETHFESIFSKYFEIEEKIKLSLATRNLYRMKLK